MPLPLGKFGDMLMKGLVAEFAPKIAKGYLVELLRKRGLSVQSVNAWVNSDNSLWASMDTEEKEGLRKMLQKVENLDWLTSDWAIITLKENYPAVASLFLGWKKGRSWLDRQIEIIKQKATG